MIALESLLIAVALIWLGGSLLAIVLVPWRKVEREDWWIACLLIGFWPPLALWMGVELLIENRRGAP